MARFWRDGSTRTVTDQRRRLLVAALGFAGCSMPSYDRALHALRTWLDSWWGIGHVTVGMARQGYDLQLTRYDEKGWRATFHTTGMEHSITSATASAWGAAVARGPGRGAGGAATGQPRWLGGAPFVIPDLETADVKLKGFPAWRNQRDRLHQQQLLRKKRVAGVARFPVAWTTPGPWDAVMW